MDLSGLQAMVLSILALMAGAGHSITLCESSACLRRARWMASVMDTHVSPCHDLYQFACGGWHRRHRVPSSKPSYSTWTEANDGLHDQIGGLLDTVAQHHPSAAVRLAGWLHRRCLEPKLETPANNRTSTEASHWTQVLLGNWRAGRLLAQPVLFSLAVTVNPTNTSENIVVLEPAELPLPDDELIRCTNRSRLMHAYRTYLGQLSDVAGLVDQVLAWECQLASFKMPASEQREPGNVIKLLSYDQLRQLTGFDWLAELLRPAWRAFGLELTPEAERKPVLVTDLDYFARLSRMLVQVPPDMVAGYWELARLGQTAPYHSERARQQLYQFLKVKTGARRTPGRRKTCYSLVEELLPWALSRLLVEQQHAAGAGAAQLARDIVDRVHQAFADTVGAVSWLDAAARNRSLHKLELLRANVAYPDWLLQDQQLDQYYHWEEKDLPAGASLSAALDRFRWRQMQANLAKLHQDNHPPEQADDWPMEPSRMNAAYSPEDNAMTIPAAILTRPYFEPELPASINYGGIGTVIGHELSHSLDDEGRQFDHRGNYVHDWWPARTVQHFEQHSSCLVRQYARIRDPVTGLWLDGRNTLGENIADNGGLQAAFHGMQLHRRQQPPSEPKSDRMPGPLSRFSPEQLFFIANAQIWCSMTRPETLRQKIQYDRHVPPRYRVNVPAANFDQFSRAFRCPVGTPMNPDRKCVLWAR